MMPASVIKGLEHIRPELRGGVAAIGNFDGVHAGHQRIIHEARARALAAGVKLTAITFYPPPEAVLGSAGADCILPPVKRLALLRDCGTDEVLFVKTTRALLALSPEEFVKQALVERFAPSCVVEGPDFRFGRRREGDIQTLRQLGRQEGFEVVQVEPVTLDLGQGGPVRVSSSLIRALLGAGDVVAAGRCLRRPYTLYGYVVGGLKRGRLLEFPTANVRAAGLVTPGDGIYAARAEIAAGQYAAAVSIGNRPTFGPGARAIEAHLLDAGGDFYDLPIALTFVARLREQRKFDSPQALRDQIAKDVQRVREIIR